MDTTVASSPSLSAKSLEQIQRRRTFGIISHPDAGKTTLTEKLLYHGGVLHETGEVKGKAGSKAVTSDWMELERQKGISITSSVMTFDSHGLRINLLDTPGHKDFSEDTYRVLMAVDSACMLIDVAKGVEERTRKLYEVCRLRQVPIFTFVNKLDREGKAPLQLIDEVEQTLQMRTYPLTWPIGIGDRFCGVYHRLKREIHLYHQRRDDVDQVEILKVSGFADPSWRDRVRPEIFDQVQEELDLIEGVLGPFDPAEYLAGKVSPLTFGSAKQNFGVDLFLEFFAEYAPGPQARTTQAGERISPTSSQFSGFVFKVQANMDKRHRDRVAFVRLCSGRFERGMKVQHARLEKEIRLSYSNQFIAADKTTVDEAFAGDIIGVADTGQFVIGDSISEGRVLEFERIPRFAPELFSKVSVKDAMRRRKLQEALAHLAGEGAVQLYYEPHLGKQDPILGVVGELQFEVLVHRLEAEYNLEVKLTRMPYTVARWPRNPKTGKPAMDLKGNLTVLEDDFEQPVVLLAQEWDLNWAKRENPEVEFAAALSVGRDRK